MSGFSVDVESLGRFRAAVERAQDQVSKLKSLAEGARLGPGTFTRTPGGQRADAAHAEMLEGIGKALNTAVGRLRKVAEATGKTMDNYKGVDEKHAAAMSGIEEQLDIRRGHQP
ncbi:MAG: hypothetical protein GEV03_12685 [Streptosporangiales bacterium]|nr:hypothetical protein [Streptosporangiales bacterium]